MNDVPLMTMSWPRAILHLDADAFFASVEQVLDPSLRGRPVVTGKERGIIACASYEAKALGIKRGITLSDAKTLCPGLVILPSDYETYSLYSRRMFNIMRCYTPLVEEYSIDEAFADITGLRGLHRTSYEAIAAGIKAEIKADLGFSVSVGLSLSKCLAKLGSKFRKHDGFTAVEGRHIHLLLQRTPLEKVWGLGPNSVSLLQTYGLRTAYDYMMRSEPWVGRLLHKPGREIWNELRGRSVWKVIPEEKTAYATLIKSKTFTPPSNDKAFVFARLVRNVEAAFMKARRYKLRPRTLGIVLRHHDFRHDGLEARLNRPTSSCLEALPLIRLMFERVFLDASRYRSTMIVLGGLESDGSEQYELFEDRLKIERLRRATEAIDAINGKYGKHALCSATSLFLGNKPAVSRDEAPARRRLVMPGENRERRLGIPRLSVRV